MLRASLSEMSSIYYNHSTKLTPDSLVANNRNIQSPEVNNVMGNSADIA